MESTCLTLQLGHKISADIPDLPEIMSSLDISDNSATGGPGKSELSGSESVLATMKFSNLEPFQEEIDKQMGTSSGRNRPMRASKSDCLLKINRRVNMKPQKKEQNAIKECSSEEDIKKFYLNNKNVNIKANHLETIFEEPTTVRNELRLIGLKKIKRSINFKDGLNITKTTLQSRRKKIKHLFGSTAGKKFNKLTMDAFLLHLQSVSDPGPSHQYSSI